jgi:hypothetical protein
MELKYFSRFLEFRTPFFLIWSLPRLWYGSLNHLSIFYNISCYNSLVLLTFVSTRSSCRITYIYIKVWNSRQNTKITHFYFLTSLKRRLFCFMITSVPFSLIFSEIKWSSVKIYVWSAFFHFRQYSRNRYM